MLGGDPNAIAGAQETGGKNRGYAHLATGLTRVDLFSLILHDLGRRSDDQ
jgi:hypothetical protein